MNKRAEYSVEEKRMIGGKGTMKDTKGIETGMKNGDPSCFFGSVLKGAANIFRYPGRLQDHDLSWMHKQFSHPESAHRLK